MNWTTKSIMKAGVKYMIPNKKGSSDNSVENKTTDSTPKIRIQFMKVKL